MRQKWHLIWPWFPVLAMFAVISWFSAQPGEVSDAQSGMVRELITAQWQWMDSLVRKLAHVALFFGLGAFAGFAWLQTDPKEQKCFRKAIQRAVILCAALGALDEFHQYFVPERAALISDVLLDTVGATLGALFAVGIARIVILRSELRSNQKS